MNHLILIITLIAQYIHRSTAATTQRDIFLQTTGIPDLSVSERQCKSYATSNSYTFTPAYGSLPLGCVRRKNDHALVYFNTYAEKIPVPCGASYSNYGVIECVTSHAKEDSNFEPLASIEVEINAEGDVIETDLPPATPATPATPSTPAPPAPPAPPSTPAPPPPIRHWSLTEKSPYKILNLPHDATQSQIRKSYRNLAKEYHPDKHLHADNKRIAQQIFEEIVSSYNILGDPDNRAAYDDFGGGQGGEDNDGFETYNEYQQALKKKNQEGGTKGPQNFYTGASLITNLNENLFNVRVKGDQIWMLEFYAPWCTHCKTMTNTWKETAEELEGDVEFGAINCEANREWCMGPRWQIKSYPTIKIIHASEDVTETYPSQQPKTKEKLLAFARTAIADWNYLFYSKDIVSFTSFDLFNTTLLHDEKEHFWVVLFSNGFRCEDCSTARTNMIRLSGAIKGVARVGTVDCSVNHDYKHVTEGGKIYHYNSICVQHLGYVNFSSCVHCTRFFFCSKTCI